MQQLAKPWYRVRALRVFRDDAVLSADPRLWSSLRAALDASRWFVLVASREAAQSEWVARELEYWLHVNSADRILVVLTDGEWQWDRTNGTVVGSAVPAALVDAFSEEPRHVDMRWARAVPELDLRETRFRDVVAQLAAPLHGVAKDDLESEDVHQHRRTRRLARGATSLLVVLLVLAVALAGIALQQRGSARHEATAAAHARDLARRQATLTLAGDLAAESSAALRAGRNDVALLLAVAAERADPSITSSRALLGAVVEEPRLARELHGLTHTTTHVVFSSDGHLLAASDGEQLRVWDVASGKTVLARPDLERAVFSDESRLLIGMDASGLQVVDVHTGRTVRTLATKDTVWSADAQMPVIAAGDPDGTVHVWNARTGAVLGLIATGEPLVDTVAVNPPGLLSTGTGLAISADASVLAVVRRPDAVVNGSFENTTTEDERAWSIAAGRPLPRSCTTSTPNTSFDDVLLNVAVSANGLVDTVRASDVNPDPNAFVATCDTTTGTTTTHTLTGPPSDGHNAVAGLSADGHLIAARSTTSIEIINAADNSIVGGPVLAPYNASQPLTRTVEFSPDGRFFAATEYNGEVRLWRTSPQAAMEHLVDLGPAPDRVLWSFGRRVAVTANGDVLDLPSRSKLAHLDRYVPLIDSGVNSERPTALALSADGAVLAARAYRSTFTQPGAGIVDGDDLTVVDLARHTQQTVHDDLPCPTGGANPIAVSDRYVAVIGCNTSTSCVETVLQTVDVSSSPLHLNSPVVVPIGRPVFSPDGRILALFTDSNVDIFDITPTGPRARSNAAQPKCNPFGSNSPGWAGAFTRDSRTLVLDRGNGLVELVPTDGHNTDTTLLSLSGDDTNCCSNPTLAVAPDGDLIVESTGAQLRLWSLHAQELIGTIPLPAPFLTTSGIITDFTASTLALDGRNGHAVQIDLDPASWIRDACTIANRNLSAAEWAADAGGTPYRTQCP